MAPNRLTLTINNPTPFYLRFHSLFTWHGRCTSTPSDVPPDTVIKSRWVAKRGSLTGVAGCVAYEVRARGYGGVLLVVGFTNSWWRGRRVFTEFVKKATELNRDCIKEMHKNRVEVTVHEDIEVRAIMDTKIPTAAVFDIWTIDEIAEIEAKAEELRTQMKRTGTNQQSGPNRIIAPPRGHERSGYTTATPMGPRVDPTPYLTTHNRQNVRILGNIPTHSRAISGQESNATTSSTPTSVSSSQSVSNSATSPGGSIFNVNWVRSGCMGVPTDIIKPEFLRAHCGKSISGEFNTLSDIFTARIGPVHNGGKPRIYMRRATTGAWNPTTGNKDFGTWPTAATLAPGASIL